ncbi:MAG: DUF805 domain-containing protein [Pseudomonadota bacterium]
MEWMFLPYRRYFEFSGRSRRKEYWLFVLFQVLVLLVIAAIFGSPNYQQMGMFFGVSSSLSITGGILQNLFALASFIPSLAVAVRRLHDQDRTGWLLLLVFIPILGWFALLVLMCLEGTRGPNRFGPDPKNPVDITAF